MAGLYSCKTNKQLASMLKGELNLRLLNDTAAREKIAEAVTRLEQSGSESETIKHLRKELAEKSKKLEKIERILQA